MRILGLLENNKVEKGLIAKHGLSIYIETNGKKILFDVGPDGTFEENAKKLGVDISEVDYLVISHGHADHGGGLKRFLEINDKAMIYMSDRAFDKYTAKVAGVFHIDIGLDMSLKDHERIKKINSNTLLDENLSLFTNCNRGDLSGFYPNGNKRLFKEVDGKRRHDDFSHEVHMLVQESDYSVLFTGCSHLGVTNILDYVEDNSDKKVTHLIGGMHLYDPIRKRSEKLAVVADLAEKMRAYKVETYYTCHCTGEEAYDQLKGLLGERINKLNTGTQISVV